MEFEGPSVAEGSISTFGGGREGGTTVTAARVSVPGGIK
jgi:hypothetical protein